MLKWSYLLILAVALVSCKDDTVEECPEPSAKYLSLTVNPEFNGQELQLDQTVTTSEGYLVQFIELKCYLEDIKSGSDLLIDAGLFDYRARGVNVFRTEGDPSKFDSINCNLGVQHSLNHSDPTLFPTNSALNIINANDMHWDWNPGYIFVKVEARVDTIPDAIENFDHNIVYHIGGDINRQDLSFNNLQWNLVSENEYQLDFKLDMSTFLNDGNQSLDLKTEFMSHTAPGQEALSLKVMELFKSALSTY
ncbi:MAG: MbnP family protein [Crocinitomicaceae bacterium]